MVQEARGLEKYLQGINQESLAKQAGKLAEGLEAEGILRITPELQTDIRTETVRVGTMSKEALQAEYRKRGIQVSSDTQYLIDKINLSTEPRDVKLTWPSGRDLGLTAISTYRSFLEAGQAKGYIIEDSEVGLYLRLQDTKQPLNDVYWMAMEPIADRDGYLHVFALGHDQDGLWLNADWTRPAGLWAPGARLVFGLSK